MRDLMRDLHVAAATKSTKKTVKLRQIQTPISVRNMEKAGLPRCVCEHRLRTLALLSVRNA